VKTHVMDGETCLTCMPPRLFGFFQSIIPKRKEIKTMNLKLSNSEAVAIMTSLQHYLKEVGKMGNEKGVEIEKKTLTGLISRLESMPAGEVQ
ncbi:MAG TPA: hypothetical protein VN328_06465, partial [Thermodesulfovibrionales bacterium]|nr:hypothetical protein [Thermodesulfovibrionales bacterium]